MKKNNKKNSIATTSESVREAKVSVVTVLYNSAAVIESLLDSINETNKDRLIGEVIIVDNNSQDRSVKVTEKYIHKHTQNLGYKIKLIKNDVNVGFGRGNNIGVGYATLPLVLFSNPDIEFKDDVVKEMSDLLTLHPEIGLVGPRIYFDRPSTYSNPVLNPLPFILRNTLGNTRFGKFLGVKPIQQGEYSKSFQVVGAFMMARSSEFLRVGGFDEDNFLYLEELQLSEKLRKLGFETVKLWTSQEIGHRIAHSQFVTTNKDLKHVTKLDLYRRAEEHYIKNYMQILTGNSALDFLIRQTVRLIYKTRNVGLTGLVYQRWLRFVGIEVIRDPAMRQEEKLCSS